MKTEKNKRDRKKYVVAEDADGKIYIHHVDYWAKYSWTGSPIYEFAPGDDLNIIDAIALLEDDDQEHPMIRGRLTVWHVDRERDAMRHGRDGYSLIADTPYASEAGEVTLYPGRASEAGRRAMGITDYDAAANDHGANRYYTAIEANDGDITVYETDRSETVCTRAWTHYPSNDMTLLAELATAISAGTDDINGLDDPQAAWAELDAMPDTWRTIATADAIAGEIVGRALSCIRVYPGRVKSSATGRMALGITIDDGGCL